MTNAIWSVRNAWCFVPIAAMAFAYCLAIGINGQIDNCHIPGSRLSAEPFLCPVESWGPLTDVAFDNSLNSLITSITTLSFDANQIKPASSADLRSEVAHLAEGLELMQSDLKNLEERFSDLDARLSQDLNLTPEQINVFLRRHLEVLKAKVDAIEGSTDAAVEEAVQDLLGLPAANEVLVAVASATARSRWQVSYLVLALTASAALLGAFAIIWLQLDDQAIDADGRPRNDAWRVEIRWLLISLVIILGLFFAGVSLALTVGDDAFASSVSRSRFYGYVTENFLKLERFEQIVNGLTFVAVIGIGVSVGLSLLVPLPFERIAAGDPDQKSSADGESNCKSEKTARLYKEYLTRCFERLRVSIYLAGVLLAVAVIHVVAIAQWPVRLLLGVEDSDGLVGALEGLITELGFAYGVALSGLLLAILLPTSVMLRRRAWRLARDRKHGAMVDDGSGELKPANTAEQQADWLANNRLQVPLKGIIAQIVAVASPVLAGTLGAVVLQGIEATAGG